ncbi:hypothetical protein OOU_Y34scaffold00733g10 [Pyricularia oryzae Y34]|uniref:Uncharacterized protein n=1 Tax=Pyricularia oryzae (strain Y34) TaxID=1143189 RepID=A0AA97NRL9_PYRO3|nr:hypothetical protein OOU_Y34scaffold00733g10 [Pyricularia oryzae Y34]
MHISKASQLMALLVIGAPVLAFTPKGDNPMVAQSPDPGAQADVAGSPKVSSPAQENWKLVNGRVVMKHPAARPDLGTEDKPNRLVARRTRYDSDNDDDDDDGPIPGSPPHNRRPKGGVARGGPSQKKPNRLVARRTRYDSDNDDDDDDGPIPGSPLTTASQRAASPGAEPRRGMPTASWPEVATTTTMTPSRRPPQSPPAALATSQGT